MDESGATRVRSDFVYFLLRRESDSLIQKISLYARERVIMHQDSQWEICMD